jgi:hypothetical protein
MTLRLRHRVGIWVAHSELEDFLITRVAISNSILTESHHEHLKRILLVHAEQLLNTSRLATTHNTTKCTRQHVITTQVIATVLTISGHRDVSHVNAEVITCLLGLINQIAKLAHVVWVLFFLLLLLLQPYPMNIRRVLRNPKI